MSADTKQYVRYHTDEERALIINMMTSRGYYLIDDHKHLKMLVFDIKKEGVVKGKQGRYSVL